jgi:hypothetical protein
MPISVTDVNGGGYVNPRVYVPGGIKGDGTLHDAMQIFHRGTGVWAVDSEVMPFGPWADAAICTDPATGVIHLLNGHDGSFIYAAHQTYTPTLPLGSRWGGEPYPMLSTGESYYSQGSGCSIISGKLFLYGGYAVVDPSPTPGITNKTWVYDIATKTWTDTGFLMTAPRFWFGYTTRGTRGFAAGGTSDLTTLAAITSTESLSPGSGWTAKAVMPVGRLGNGMAAVGTTVVVFGGASGDATSGFTLQDKTVRCAMNMNCAAWSNLNKDLNTPRWFASYAGAGSTTLAALYAGGAGVSGASTAAERLP